jgi:hypothetical protein
LDVRTVELQHARIDVERRELVGADLAVGVGQCVHERGFADAREAHDGDRRVAVFLDVIAAAPTRGLLTDLQFLLLFRELGFEPADMLFGRLVVGRTRNLLAEVFDFLFKPHYTGLGDCSPKTLPFASREWGTTVGSNALLKA